MLTGDRRPETNDVRGLLRRAREVLLSGVASPVAHTDTLQIVKSTVAAVLAWVLADRVLGLHQPFLAPWVALLTLHATVHRTARRGVETVVAVVMGIGLSFVVLQLFGASTSSLAVALLGGLALSRLPWLRNEGVLVATTALFVITTGAEESQRAAIDVLPDRALDTALGVVVALLVNLVVIPPLHDRSAEEQVDRVNRRLGELLVDIATELESPRPSPGERDWIERTRSIDDDLDRAWSLVSYSRESRRWNPRHRRHGDVVPAHLGDVLLRLEDGVAQARSIARHIVDSEQPVDTWDPAFRDRFVPLLAALGDAVADPAAEVARLRGDIDSLVTRLSSGRVRTKAWPLYGALIANTRVMIDIVDDVASARPVRT